MWTSVKLMHVMNRMLKFQLCHAPYSCMSIHNLSMTFSEMDNSLNNVFLLTKHTKNRASGNGNRNPERMLKNIEPGIANVCKLWRNRLVKENFSKKNIIKHITFKVSVTVGQGYISLQIPCFLGRETIQPKFKLEKKLRREQ